MAFAPFKSTDNVLGSFREKSHGNLFEITEDPKATPPWVEFAQKVWVGSDQFRWARVLKTVAYIVVDEDAAGKPVTEKWNIKDYKTY